MRAIWLDGRGATRSNRFLREALPRGVALFLGGFGLVNLLGEVWVEHFDANLTWIDLRYLPAAVARGFVLVSALALAAYAVRPPRAGWRRALTGACAAGLGVAALINAAGFCLLQARGAVHAGLPLPLSLFTAGALGFIAQALWRPGRGAIEAEPRGAGPGRRLLSVLAVCAACALLFPLAQMFFFGKTDYRRRADVAVVLGARAYKDGRPSDALADRVRTACRLYREGWVGKLLFSGGPGDGAVHETEAMKRLAVRLGVDPADILTDLGGLNTQATVRNTEAICRQLHASRILVVSHFYHLPRIKLAYQRSGREVYTVPAQETYLLRQLPFNMAREVAALWVYYARPLVGARAA